MRTTSIILLAAVALAAVSMVAAQAEVNNAGPKIHLKPGAQKVRGPLPNTAEKTTVTAKVIGADGKPVGGDVLITFASGATVAEATAALTTDPLPVTAQTDATGHATATLAFAAAGKFVVVAGMPRVAGNGAANEVVSAPAHVIVKA